MPNKDNTGIGYPEGYQPATTGYPSIVNQRASTGFAKWGFVIYRGTYDNDTRWETFITLLKASLVEELQYVEQEDELGPDLEWTIIEDRTNLEGASKDNVRAQFLEWVAARSVERDGVQANVPWLVKYVPRFRYCLYVDEASFGSITAHRVRMTGQWCLDGGKVVIIDGTHGHNDEEEKEEDDSEESEEDDGYTSVEGNTSYDVGWAYIDAIGLGDLYASLCWAGCDSEKWEGVYRGRRPDRGPDRGQGQPLSAVDEV
ncbi:hypothetical protein ACHAQA_006690 [Verticillium albo-atrum]